MKFTKVLLSASLAVAPVASFALVPNNAEGIIKAQAASIDGTEIANAKEITNLANFRDAISFSASEVLAGTGKYYKVVVSKYGKLTLNLPANLTASVVSEKDLGGSVGTLTSTSKNIALPAGTYYIKVTATQAGAYSFTGKFTDFVVEDESSIANDITNYLQNGAVSFAGTFDKVSDLDQYSFTLSEPTKITFDLNNVPSTASVGLVDSKNQAYTLNTTPTTGVKDVTLPAGKYYLQVKGTGYSGAPVSYYIDAKAEKVASNLFVVNEQEPNNSLAQATNVALEGKTNAVLNGAYNGFGDADYYKLSVGDKVNNLTISIPADQYTNDITNLSLVSIDDKGQETTIVSAPSSATGGVYTFDLSSKTDYLNVKTYYLKVEGPKKVDALVDKNYNINVTVNYGFTAYSEDEPNNDVKTANDITNYLNNYVLAGASVGTTKNGTISGTFESAGTSDFYRFTLTKYTDVDLTIETGTGGTLTDSTATNKGLISLLDANNQKVTITEATSGGNTVLKAGLPAGTYYLKIDNNSTVASQDYNIKLGLTQNIAPVKPLDVTVYNNIKVDKVNIKNLTVGQTYKLEWENGSTVIPATSAEQTITVDKLGKEKGILTVYRYDENTLNYVKETEVVYAAETANPTTAVAASDVVVYNYYNKDDVVKLSNLEKGVKYSVYTSADLTADSKVDEFTAAAATKNITLPNGVLSANGGSIYVVAEADDKNPSAATAVSYKAEIQLKALAASNVTVKNNVSTSKDTIAFKGLTKGYTYTVYSDSKLTKKLASFTATGATKSVSVKLAAKGGKVYVVASKSGYKASKATAVSYKAEPTKALAAKNVKVSNTKKKDTVKLTGLTKGTTYTIYNGSKKLASFKATGTTKTLTVKLNNNGGTINVVAQAPGYLASSKTAVKYGKQK